ncbi:MAG TPA: hypothetical protein VND15_04145 [Candidatus Acidoferrales bacterium]|nr:hypothetical protein [Candidatus Acidoferrales bacterium]
MAKKVSTKNKGAPKGKRGGAVKIAAAVVAIVIIAAAGFEIYTYLTANAAQQSASFSTFESNFNSAPRVAIFATAYNGTVLSSTVGCATAVIVQIVGSQAHHRDPGTIDYFVINKTSCVYAAGGLGKPTSNYTTTSLQHCLNVTGTEPTIYLNYTATNTTIIRPEYFYTSGNAAYLAQCGIANELG